MYYCTVGRYGKTKSIKSRASEKNYRKKVKCGQNMRLGLELNPHFSGQSVGNV